MHVTPRRDLDEFPAVLAYLDQAAGDAASRTVAGTVTVTGRWGRRPEISRADDGADKGVHKRMDGLPVKRIQPGPGIGDTRLQLVHVCFDTGSPPPCPVWAIPF